MNGRALWAILKRDFLSYFGSPLGYLFIVFFVVATAAAQFGRQEFFNQNQASLDLLSQAFPWILLFLVPGITMASWAAERRLGTDELLHTLPLRDGEVVLAKFGACLGIYTVALLFTLSHVVTLEVLGDPDLGLVRANYVGYWLLGGALVAAGMFASSLTRNLTLAYVLGVLFCAIPLALHFVAGFVPGPEGELVGQLAAVERFEGFTRGAVALEDVLYFVLLSAALLYGNAVVLDQRFWSSRRSRPVHRCVRLASVAAASAALVLLSQRPAARADVTSEGLLSLNPEVVEILEGLDAQRPVFVQAWLSPELPGEYAGVRDELVRVLDELDAHGGDRLEVVIHATELYSPEAQEAEEAFGIEPRTVHVKVEGRETQAEVFLGLAFTCGPKEEVIPFFDPGLPVQYELARAIGVVADAERATVGVLKTGVDMFGGFDFQSMRQSRDWQVVEELRKQYEVEPVDGVAPIDTSLDVLLVPMPSTLPQPKLDRVADFLRAGGKALFLCDPFPIFNPALAPPMDPGPPRNPFQPNRAPPPEPKGDAKALLASLGVQWDPKRIVWDDHNPHPTYQQFDKEYVFAVAGSAERPSGFNEEDPVTSGLQEVLLVFPGAFETIDLADVTVTPLLRTGSQSGSHPWEEMVDVNPMFGMVQPKPPGTRRYEAAAERQVLAVRARGKLRAGAADGAVEATPLSEHEFEAIVVADCDFVHDFAYELRRRSDEIAEEFDLDNVTFLSNCIDSLAGEEAFLELRKHRPAHRTLARLEAIEEELRQEQRKAAKEANAEAEAQLAEARKRLDEALAAIERDEQLDYRTKAIQKRYVTDREQRKLEAQEIRIESEKKDKVRQVEVRNKRRLMLERNRIRLAATVLPPLPAVLLGLVVFVVGRIREVEGAAPSRRR